MGREFVPVARCGNSPPPDATMLRNIDGRYYTVKRNYSFNLLTAYTDGHQA
jgi:hypothetical protein